MKNPITETKVTSVNRGKDRNANWRTAVVFTNDNGAEIVDAFFDKHKIHSMDFRCNTWSWLKRQIQTIAIAKIRAHFKLPESVSICWSDYAGCSCPCSKGFVVKGENHSSFEHFGAWVWMDLLFTDEEIKQIKRAVEQAEVKLAKELHKRANPPKPEVQMDLVTITTKPIDYRAN
jgi:hypothetical protein